MKLINPLYHLRYGDKRQYKRSLSIALNCWWKWEVVPWFKRKDYICGVMGDKPYKLSIYRWEKYLSPTLKKLCNTKLSDELLTEREY